MYNDIRKNENKGFSLVELIVVIAIMAVMTAVLAPALLQYVEKSRAQKDDSAMGEVVEVIKLALSEQEVYDECLCYTVKGNTAKYVVDGAGNEDEKPWKFSTADTMRGLTITFQSAAANNEAKFILAQGKINHGYAGSETAFNGGAAKGATLGDYNDGTNDITTGMSTKLASDATHTHELYTRVKAGIENGEVKLTSQTYRNSDYTVFIKMGGSDEAVVVYGQWNGTNLASNTTRA